MTNLTPLSPAAQAVLYATHKAMAEQQTALSGVPDYRQVAAAALRAAADQLGESRAPGAKFEDLYPRIIEVDDLLAIADELEAQ